MAAAVAAAGAAVVTDRVGLLWRRALAGEILTHAGELDLVEVIAEEWLGAPERGVRALSTLAAQLPVTLHGVSMGLASAAPVAEARLEAMARLCERVQPLAWSEHLAFVRGGGVELGHLAAPPRTAETVDGAARNVRRAAAVVGSWPRLENVATLIEPPASSLDEVAWLSLVIDATGAELLLDLHNLYANAASFGRDATQALEGLPLERVTQVHLAGGRWVGEGSPRLLDDHRHAVPDAVFALLETLASLAPRPLTVIIERDADLPPFAELLAEVRRAREALARGRAAARALPRLSVQAASVPPRRAVEEAVRLEAFLARLYADAGARRRFLSSPIEHAVGAGFSQPAAAALAGLDRVGLALAAESLARKRHAHAQS